MIGPPLLLSDVAKSLGGRPVLDGLILRLDPGEVVALLGANGSGKTTTLNLILGFLTPDRGTVTIDGIDVHADPAAAQARRAYLPERVALYPHLSGSDNLRYFGGLAGLRLDADERSRLLTEVGLPAAVHRQTTRSYSKGMCQKVGIAIALARQTTVLLLDEPGSGLDPAATVEFACLVRRVAALGTAVLVVTHDLFGVRDMADRAVVLEHGRIGRSFAPHAIDADAVAAIYGGTPAQ